MKHAAMLAASTPDIKKLIVEAAANLEEAAQEE